MALVNDLIRRAKTEPPPVELTVKPRDVRRLAEHAYGCNTLGLTVEVIERRILRGEILFRGIPLRVLGQGDL